MALSSAGVSYSLLGQTSLGAVFMPVNAKGVVTTVPAHPGTNSGQRASLLINTPDGFKPITAQRDTKRAFHELGLVRQDLRGKNAALIADGTAALVKFRTKAVTSSHEGIVHRAQAAVDAVAKFSSLEVGLLTDIKNLDVAGADAKIPELLAATKSLHIDSYQFHGFEDENELRQTVFVVMASKLKGASFERRNQVLDQLEAKFYAHGNAMPTGTRLYFDSLREMRFEEAAPFMSYGFFAGMALNFALVFVGADAMGVFGAIVAWANVMSWGAGSGVPDARHVPQGGKLSSASMALSLVAGTLLPVIAGLGEWSEHPVLVALAASLAVSGQSMRDGAAALSRRVLDQQPAAK